MKSRTVGVLALGLTCVIGAGAAADSLTHCFSFNGGSKELTVDISNGCVSSSFRYLDHDLKIEVRQRHAVIQTDGGFNYEPYGARIATTDCGGGRQERFTVSGVEPRRYVLVHDGRRIDVVDLTAEHGRICIQGGGPRARVQSFKPGWARLAGGNLGAGDQAGETLMRLIALYVGDHPETGEGVPAATVKFEPGDGDDMRVSFEMTGYLDDSVSGERYQGVARLGADGWRFVDLWRQTLCARGGKAGQWTDGLCG